MIFSGKNLQRKIYKVQIFYRIRVDNYRVIYQVDNKANILVIYYVGHRREAYRKRK